MNKSSFILKLAVCLCILSGCVLIALCAGSVWISPVELFRDLFTEGLSRNERIILYIRLPRILATVLAGSALAVSGGIIQAVLSNPLAAPNIIGVNSGAGFFTVLCMAIFPAAVNLIPAAAFLGALVAVLLVYMVARKTGASRMTIVLTGVGVSSLLNAAIDTVTTLFPDAVIGISSFKAGGVSGTTLKSLFPAWVFILIGIVLAIMLSHDLDVLSLGESTAKSLGMNVSLMRFVRRNACRSGCKLFGTYRICGACCSSYFKKNCKKVGKHGGHSFLCNYRRSFSYPLRHSGKNNVFPL